VRSRSSDQHVGRCQRADVSGRDIRVANKEEVAFKSKPQKLFNRFAVLRTFEPIPHPEKDLVEPTARLSRKRPVISSGVAAFTVSAGRDSGVARSVVVAGMHPGRAGADAQTCSDLTSDIGYPGRTGDVAAVTIFFEG